MFVTYVYLPYAATEVVQTVAKRRGLMTEARSASVVSEFRSRFRCLLLIRSDNTVRSVGTLTLFEVSRITTGNVTYFCAVKVSRTQFALLVTTLSTSVCSLLSWVVIGLATTVRVSERRTLNVVSETLTAAVL